MRLYALILVLAVAGCSQSLVRYYPGNHNVQFTGDPAIREVVEAANSRLTFAGSDLGVYQVDLLSRFNSDLGLEYRSTWFDAKGNAINDATKGWHPIVLPAASQVTLQAVAPNAIAENCSMEVRLTQPIEG